MNRVIQCPDCGNKIRVISVGMPNEVIVKTCRECPFRLVGGPSEPDLCGLYSKFGLGDLYDGIFVQEKYDGYFPPQCPLHMNPISIKCTGD